MMQRCEATTAHDVQMTLHSRCVWYHTFTIGERRGKRTSSGLNTRSSTVKTAHGSRSFRKLPHQRACRVGCELHLIELDDKEKKKMLGGSSDLAALPDDVTVRSAHVGA